MSSNTGTHGSRAEYGYFLDSLQQSLLRVETNDCKRWDAENGGKSSNSEKKMPTIGAAARRWRSQLDFVEMENRLGSTGKRSGRRSPVKKRAARAENVG
jgi:hypothetical protein